MYAEVAVEGKAHLLLHYEIPSRLNGKLAPGHLVRVPLRNDEQLGVVVRLSSTAPVSSTRPISELVDPVPVVDDEHMALAHWLADHYMTPVAHCLWLMMPPRRVGPSHVRSVELVATPAQIEAARPNLGRPVKQADILDWLVAAKDPLPTIDDVLAGVDCSESTLRALAQRTWVEIDREGDLKTVLLLLPPKAARARAAELRGSEIYYAVLDYLTSQNEAVPVEAVKAATRCELRHLRRLEELELVFLSETQVARDPLADVAFVSADPPVLTPDQRQVLEPIESALTGKPRKMEENGPCFAPDPPVFLLHGVTGSGKTEIYLRAVAATLAQGRRAIVLVPEISLTPQTTQRFLARFPGRVGLFHSNLSEGERYETWQRAHAGKIDVLIGPRSALFIPLPDLGLIVLDEEHDASFKSQDRMPVYHAREVALEKARHSHAVVILGSATPSLESYHRAQAGEFCLLRLPQRIRTHARWLEQQQQRYQLAGTHYRVEQELARYIPLPPVQVVDLRQELRAGNHHIFSRALQEALRETLSRGEQSILFLNRRGHATFVLCRDCGHVVKCPRCDAPLTQHIASRTEFRTGSSEQSSRRPPQLVCHHCNYRIPVPDRCPECGRNRIRYFGLGTQRVEQAIQALLPGVRTLRWDRDTASRRGAHQLILERFARRQADVLIGTQMIAKGLDLPLVTLVGVISADTALNLPDFRAGERTFQLLTQVAGRAGRGLLGGRVIVQTYAPQHYAIQAARRHSFTDFAAQELSFRREQGYPPYRRLAQLEYRHRKPKRARQAAERLASALRQSLAARSLPAEDVMGPAPAFFAKLRGRYRWHILLRAEDPADLLRQVDIPAGWRIDIDPVNLL
jgi:primosomal protein N' (replication factor Y)